MNDHANFINIVNGSEAVRERWAAITEKAISDARDHGVTIEPNDVLSLREARLAAMGAPLDEAAYRDELLNLPALSKVAQKKAISEGDEEARAAALADLNRGREKEHYMHHTAHAARRLSEARAMGIATPPPAHDTISRDEKLRLISEVDDAATRLSLARKWGLV
ncbi:MAG: hypothetical protein VR71_23730 [Roseovarius sp. BRH_c41]|uniref:hypothetical protein n=1 Tax=Roseovarius sp. BRH_c41 TaxID=1629709 RepID=UPI0005F26790|nr:hypothetical protein [Roseovarius sp. BRH_c41]KJS40320.1 MAG: hypothetical protein VR71_23730 [Roseovarius sp. BRH_c41]